MVNKLNLFFCVSGGSKSGSVCLLFRNSLNWSDRLLCKNNLHSAAITMNLQRNYSLLVFFCCFLVIDCSSHAKCPAVALWSQIHSHTHTTFFISCLYLYLCALFSGKHFVVKLLVTRTLSQKIWLVSQCRSKRVQVLGCRLHKTKQALLQGKYSPLP